jgi:tRNA-specific 2-thiouridylase
MPPFCLLAGDSGSFSQGVFCSEMNEERRVMVAMSGGVDSSVAALLLGDAGYDCTGVTMKLFDNEAVGIDADCTCCSARDADDARGVARRLGIPHFVFNLSRDFKERVVERFIEAYECGLTPNPCIDCNRFIKFDKLLLRAKETCHGFIATGHYARTGLDAGTGRFVLKKARDETKDQSYVLYSMTQEQLSRTLFPLGDMEKTDVRQVALSHGFSNAEKKESQDICFVPDGDYAGFIERQRGELSPPGCFVDETGRVLGRHRGIIRYTVGQRRRLGLPFSKGLYVCRKNAADGTVTLGDDRSLYSRVLIADDINLIPTEHLSGRTRVAARVRYRQRLQPAVAEQISGDAIRIEFDEPQRAVAPGQAVVMYDGDVVLGGGTIQRSFL